MDLLNFAEDPLEEFCQKAAESTLRTSCDELRFYDYLCWSFVINSIKEGNPVIELNANLRELLLKANHAQLRRICSGAIASFAFRRARSVSLRGITDEIMQSFILQHKYTVSQYGSEYATQVFGISHGESERFLKSSRFLDNRRIKGYTLVMRCSQKTIIDLLKADAKDEANIQALRLRKNQECISDAVTTQPDIMIKNTICAYDPETDEGRANITQAKKLLALQMLIQGFTTHAVSVELGLSPRQCRHIAEHARAARYLDSIPSSSASAGGVLCGQIGSAKNGKSNKTCKTILRCVETTANSSILMRLYISLGGKNAKAATQVIHICNAYSLYASIRHDAYDLAERSSDKRLTIQDAWILAVDYRSRRSYLRKCNSCNCDIFRSTIQKSETIVCPFC